MPPPSAIRLESNRSPVINLRPPQRPPADQFILDFVDNLRFPLHVKSGRAARHPMRCAVVNHIYRLQVLHETGQILEIPPKAVELLRGFVNGHILIHADAEFIRHPIHRAGTFFITAFGGIDTQRLVHVAMPADTAP